MEQDVNIYFVSTYDSTTRRTEFIRAFEDEEKARKIVNTIKQDMLAKYKLTTEGGDWECLTNTFTDFVLVHTRTQIQKEVHCEIKKLANPPRNKNNN